MNYKVWHSVDGGFKRIFLEEIVANNLVEALDLSVKKHLDKHIHVVEDKPVAVGVSWDSSNSLSDENKIMLHRIIENEKSN